MNKTLYMAYGSNLNLRQMAKRCPTATVVGTAYLEDYQLLFSRVATIVPMKGSVVPVGIWEIDEVCERALDLYEGYPTLYRKEYLPVMIGGEERSVMVYIMNEDRPQLPSKHYYSVIEEGYADVGFDPVHLREAIAETEARMK